MQQFRRSGLSVYHSFKELLTRVSNCYENDDSVMMSLRCYLILLLFIFFSPLQGLPSETEKSTLPEGSVSSEARFYFGGWMDLLYLSQEQDGQDSYLNVPHMYAFADLSFDEKWRGFIEVRRINAPGAEETVDFERLYLEYRHSIPLKIRIGRINTPAGLWQYMHWAFTIDSTEKPLIEQKHFFPTESDGIHILGTKVFGSKEIEYSFFTNYGGKNKEYESKNELGYGLDWSISLWERTKTGLFFSQFKDDGMGHDPNPGDRKVTLFYNETQLFPEKLLWRTEYLHLQRTGMDSLDGFYSKLRFNINQKWYLNLRFDQTEDLSPDQNIYTHKAHSFTVGFQPTTFLRLRAEYSKQSKNITESYEHSSIWVGVRF